MSFGNVFRFCGPHQGGPPPPAKRGWPEVEVDYSAQLRRGGAHRRSRLRSLPQLRRTNRSPELARSGQSINMHTRIPPTHNEQKNHRSKERWHKGVVLYFGGVKKKSKKIVCDWPICIIVLNCEDNMKKSYFILVILALKRKIMRPVRP